MHYSSAEIELKYDRELWICNKCKSGYIQHIIDKDTSERLYKQYESSKRWHQGAAFKESKTNNVLNIVNRLFTDAKSVLDIGCNTGELLDHAKLCGCKTYGMEYSRTAADICISKGHSLIAESQIAGMKFDIITAFDVVEHVCDIGNFVDLCHSALASKGKLILLTGNINSLPAKLCKQKWWYVSPAEHIIFPSREFFSQLAKWNLSKWVRCYNSKSFIPGSWTRIKYTVAGLMRNYYSAYYSFVPDHALIVLEKKSGMNS